MTAAGGAFRTLGGSLPSWLGLASHRLKPVAAVAAMLVVWQVLTTVLPPRWLIPSPAAIFVQMHKDG
jgi:ABC-type nitrate/sulfonate/bicarbonate transport system permease component